MMALFKCTVFALLLTSIAGNKLSGGSYDYMDDNYDYDYGDDYPSSNFTDDQEHDDHMNQPASEEKVVVVLPKIVSESHNSVVDLGTTIRLPCMVDQNSDGITFIWKRPDIKSKEILAIGAHISNPDPNNRTSVDIREKGSILNIGVATVEDAGKYECSLAVNNQDISITHTVSIRVPPTITKHSETYIETEKGQQVAMECRGTGNPAPSLKWTRIGKGKMPDGKETLEGEEFVIRNVNRHHAGVYRCTADNGFTRPAYKDIELRVVYKPEITVEEVFVHTKTGNEAELVCNVHGVPKPAVEWRKDGSAVAEEANKIVFQNVHSKHSLIIKSVAKSDFGKYTCAASSPKGTAQETLEISGYAGPASYKSAPAGRKDTSYLLEWTVISHSPVTAFRVEHRPEGVSAWTEATATPIEDGPFHYAGKLYLKGLEGATVYEARVMTRNEEGWNKHKNVFSFATRGAVPRQEGSTSSASSLLPFYSLLLLISLRLSF